MLKNDFFPVKIYSVIFIPLHVESKGAAPFNDPCNPMQSTSHAGKNVWNFTCCVCLCTMMTTSKCRMCRDGISRAGELQSLTPIQTRLLFVV